jgi:hypothetical protein
MGKEAKMLDMIGQEIMIVENDQKKYSRCPCIEA